jgi:hypothetical protein
MIEDTELEGMVQAVERVLAAAGSKPSKISIYYEWVETDNSEELRPHIELAWYPQPL